MHSRPQHYLTLLALIISLSALASNRIITGIHQIVVFSDFSELLTGNNSIYNRSGAHTHVENIVTSSTPQPEQDANSNFFIGENISVNVSPFVAWKDKWGTNHSPCVVDPPSDGDPMDTYIQRQPSKEGILYIKIEKAASSTVAGVAARIAHVLGRDPDSSAAWKDIRSASVMNNNSTAICRVRLAHLWSIRTSQLSLRTRHKSFLFTFLRNPSHRALSGYYFFSVNRSNNKTLPPDHEIIDGLKKYRNSQLLKITDNVPTRMIHRKVYMNNTAYYKQEMAKQVEESLSQMDFVGLVERMDESLVLLQLLLDLKTSDVLFVTSSKQSGTWESNAWRGERSCNYLTKHTTPPLVHSFLKSQEWAQTNYGDELLYRVVNARLDATIEAIGKTTFERALQDFHNAKSMVDENCPPPILACDASGTYVKKRNRHKCYWDDAGCGYQCLDKLFNGNNSLYRQ